MGKSVNKQNRIVDGIPFPEHYSDLHCLLYLFRNAPTFQKYPDRTLIDGKKVCYTGQGRFHHAQQIAKFLWPNEFEWHDWSEKVVEKACNSHWLAISGCGTSSKSTSIALYSILYWMCAPLDTAVLIASTTIESSKKRIWKEISRLYAAFSQRVGGYNEAVIGASPRPYISPLRPSDNKRDEAHGLYVTALQKSGDLEKEIGYIKGFHPRRILVVADELDTLNEGGQALVQTFNDNLQSGTLEAEFIGLGNDPSLLNALGELMQPELGKPVTLEHKDWVSAREVNCLRLDAWDSPNIRENNKWTGIIRQIDIDNIVKFRGENSPSVWIQLRGLHPPEGCTNTVLSDATLTRFHCFDKVDWQHSFIVSASLDPGFGGDPCCYRTYKRGNDITGQFRISIDEVIHLPVIANDPTNPAEYQIAHKCMDLSRARSIPPEEFVVGATGIGRGTASVLQREWSPRINVCEEGGACSSRIVSEENPKPAHELYDRKVTEIWFSIREFVEADIIRNLDQVTARQLCSREFDDKGTGKGRRLSIRKKEEMVSSPNEADSFGFYIDMLREKGVMVSVQSEVKEQASLQVEQAVQEWEEIELGDYSEEFADL